MSTVMHPRRAIDPDVSPPDQTGCEDMAEPKVRGSNPFLALKKSLLIAGFSRFRKHTWGNFLPGFSPEMCRRASAGA